MNSTFQDRLLQTSCKNCIFAKYEDNTQIECLSDRLKHFELIEAYDLEKNFYVVKGFCNYYRSSAWNNGIPDATKAKEESSVTFDIIIDCSTMDESYYKTLSSFIQNINYAIDKYRVILCHNMYSNDTIKNNVVNLYKVAKSNYSISIYSNFDEYLYNYIIKSKKSYHMLISNNEEPDTEILNTINNKINDQLIKILTAKTKGGIKVISNHAFKMLSSEINATTYSSYIDGIIKLSTEKGLHVEL